MPQHVIRKIGLAHCKKGPARCDQCREMDAEQVCLLALYPPGEGTVQRRLMQIDVAGQTEWYAFEVVRAFGSEEEARDYAAHHQIGDVLL